MNATTSVSQAQSGNDANQLSAPASNSAATGANSQDFARALSDAGGKPSRKPATHRTTSMDSGGGQLPAAGNPSPPRSPAPQAAAAPAAGAPAAGAPAAAPAAPNSPASLGQAAAGAAAAPAGTPPAAQLNIGSSLSPPAAIAQPAGLQAATVGNANGPNLTAATRANTQAPGAHTATDAALGISGAAIPAAARSGVRAAGADSAASKAAPALVDGTASLSRSVAQGGAADSTGGAANAPASMAAAMARAAAEPPSAPSSAAPAAGAPAADSLSPASVASSPVKLLDAAQANAEQAGAVPAGVAPAPAIALPMPVAPAAAAAAATAATNTQALLTRASAGAADKHAPGSAAIPSLSLTPNDGGNGAAGAAQLLTNPTASTAATPAPVLRVAATVDSAEFGQGVATQVSLMVDRNLNSASLQVNPPALGPIEVRIALQGGHAQVWFTSHSPVTRDALESSASKLREMLGTQGFAQVSVDISQRSFQERSAQSQSYGAMAPERSAAGPGASAQVRSAGSIPRAASGLLDAYA